jgi:hypothetical protein
MANRTADINDVYLFRSPENNNNLVGVITISPLIMPAENLTRGAFDPLVQYQIHIDRNSDLRDDVTVNIRMTNNPPQIVLEGLGASPFTAPITPPGAAPMVKSEGGLKVFAGLRDDPFFFDVAAFRAFLANPQAPAKGLRPAGGGDPVDGFAGTNVLAVVFEAPATAVSGAANANSGTIKSWVSTTKGGARIDRMAIPTINTALIPSAQKDAFNQSDPVDDASKYRATAVTTIKGLRGVVDGLFGNKSEDRGGGPLGNLTAEEVGGALIPDIVTVDLSKPVQFPNGRRLQDDVIDAALGVVLNRGGMSGIADGVGGNDKAFLSTFPYLAEPHAAGGPAAAAATGAGAAMPAIRPPSTGDAGLISQSAIWTLSALFFVTALGFAGAGTLVAMRRRG